MINKSKKEAKRRYEEARKGLTAEQIEELNRKEAKQESLNEKIESLHVEMFPEEYDFMYDSIADVKDRNRGINPMSDEYCRDGCQTEKVWRVFMGP